MDAISASAGTASAESTLVRQASVDNIGKTASLIKKSLQSDQNLVNELLPAPQGQLDTKA
jgi:hypothetical protein